MLTMVESAARWMENRGFIPVARAGRYAFDAEIPGAIELTCYYSPHGGVEVTYFWVHRDLRGTGYAKELMDRLCQWADKHGYVLRLWAMPFRGPNITDAFVLAAWYARNFGFEPIRASGPPTMVRMLRMPYVRGH